MPRFQQNHIMPRSNESRIQPLGQRPRFKADALYGKAQLIKIPDQAFWLAAYHDLPNQLARRVDHTHCSLSARRRCLHNTPWLFLA
jgi:hypothetical protein